MTCSAYGSAAGGVFATRVLVNDASCIEPVLVGLFTEDKASAKACVQNAWQRVVRLIT